MASTLLVSRCISSLSPPHSVSLSLSVTLCPSISLSSLTLALSVTFSHSRYIFHNLSLYLSLITCITTGFYFQQEKDLDPVQYKTLHFQMVEKIKKNLKDPISHPGLELCTQYVQAISISELEEESANFAAGHQVRTSLIEYLRKRTEQNGDFPLRGWIKKIGSSWDGSKVGQLDEVDTLFVLDLQQLSLVPVAEDTPGVSNILVAYKGGEHNAQQLSEIFAGALVKVLDSDPPNDMEHNGYAAPQFSGIRVSGPAWTVLFRTGKDFGPMKKGSMVSVDITLALPFQCVKDSLQLNDALADISSWTDGIVKANKNKPLELPNEPHLIPSPGKGHWKLTTAHIEANVLHELETQAAAKRAYRLLKCLYRKLDKFIFSHKIIELEISENELHDKLLMILSPDAQPEIKANLRECMQYGHVLLTPEERKKYNELPKKCISVNTAAIKHLVFQKAETDDYSYMPDGLNENRTSDLMKDVISEYTSSDFFVVHGIHVNFDPICKFSALETLGDKICELAKTFLGMSRCLLSADLWEVSTYLM